MSTNRVNPLWLQIASITDPDFGAGVSWNTAPHVFDNLEIIGLVERVKTANGHSERAVITEQGRAALERMRVHVRARNDRRAASQAEGVLVEQPHAGAAARVF